MVTTKALVPAIGGYAFIVIPGTVLAIYITYLIGKGNEPDVFVNILIQVGIYCTSALKCGLRPCS